MNDCKCSNAKQFWMRVKEANASELVISVINAAKAHVEYSRAINASRRAEILLGASFEQKKYISKAELEYRKRNSQLSYAKNTLAQVLKKANEQQKKYCEEYFNRGGFKEFTHYARNRINLHLLDCEITPEDTSRAVEQLDSTYKAIEGLTNVEEVNKYLQSHMDELIHKKMGNPNASGWCVLGLLLSSMLVILIIIAALICAMTFGLACEGLLDQMIENVCGS